MRTRILRLLIVTVGLIAMCAMPAFANHIDNATVTANCTGFTIHVDGSQLNPSATFLVNYSIVLTPQSGPAITVNGSIPVTPDANNNFNASETKSWADFGVSLNGTYDLTGTAALFGNGLFNNQINIVFSPATLTCPGVCTGSMGDFVWNDLNHNGIQDSGEPGIPNITVQLWDSTLTTMLQTTTTDASGIYHFSGLCSDTYNVVVPAQPGLSGYVPSPTLQGGSFNTDSNPNPFSVFLPPNGVDNSIDFGYFIPAPHLTISKNPKDGTFVQGSQVSFTILVGNDGGAPATNAKLTDQLPSNGGLQWTGYTTTQGVCFLSVGNFLNCDFGTIPPAGSVTVTVTSSNPTPATACQVQPNPLALATADGGLQAQDSGMLSCTPPPLPCPAGSFTFNVDAAGNLNIVFDQFPAPNDNSYGINAVGWGSHGHTFGNLTGSDHAGFQLKDPNGVVKLSFNIDYLSASATAPSGYESLGPFGGDGKVVIGTLTPADISYTTSLAKNLNNINIPGLFNASHVQQFGSVNVLVNSPPTDPQHQTYSNSDPLLAGWDFHDTYFVTINAAKLASLGFNSSWVVEPNLDALHNSPAKPCPPPSTSQGLSVTKREVKDKQVKITLLNSGSVDEFITALQVTWPASNGKLMQVKLDGDVMYDNPDIAPPSANLTASQLAADPNKRKIKHGESDVLTLIFEKNADPNLANYTGMVSTSGFGLPILP
jgi:uncharacterized repeat protein (TIGR01451 family)